MHQIGFSQTKNSEYYNDLAKGFGYASGIEITNEIITDKFPDLEKRVILAQLDFNFAHGDAVKNIQKELFSNPNLDINEIRKKQRELIYERGNIEGITHSVAEKYLTNFKEERIKGSTSLYSEFVKILLRHNPKYNLNPISEFLNGFVAKIDTDNHPKSRGLKLAFEYPMSWIIQEGKRPNVIKLFKSYNGSCSVTIIVKDIISGMREEGIKLSHEELRYIRSKEYENEMINSIYTEEFYKNYFSEAGFKEIKDLSFNKTKIEGQPAFMINASGIIERTTFNRRVWMKSYVILYQNYTINIGMVVNDINGELVVEKDKYSKLFDLMVNSLVIKNKWQ